MTWAQRRRRRGERVALRLLEQAGRKCGDCQACCELLAIHATQSPAGEKCRHQFAGGCAVHGTSAVWPASAVVGDETAARAAGATEADFCAALRGALARRYASLGVG